MNVLWLAWIPVVLLAVASALLLMGKGGFLIAGYNTANNDVKQKYNVKRLCRVVGGGTSVLTIILGVAAFYSFEGFVVPWLIPLGLLGTVAVIAILANTICYAKPNK